VRRLSASSSCGAAESALPAAEPFDGQDARHQPGCVHGVQLERPRSGAEPVFHVGTGVEFGWESAAPDREVCKMSSDRIRNETPHAQTAAMQRRREVDRVLPFWLEVEALCESVTTR
jgi:hypothetical protein